MFPEYNSSEFSCRIVDNDYIEFIYKEGARLKINQVRAQETFLLQFLPKEKMPIILDIRELRESGIEVRRYAQVFAETHFSMTAIIVGENLSKIFGGFALGLNRPELPIQLFRSIEEAKKWILQNKESLI